MPTMRFCSIALLLLLATGITLAAENQSTDPATAGVEELWFDPWTLEKSDTVSLELPTLTTISANQAVPFTLRVSTSVPYQNTYASLRVYDSKKEVVEELQTTANLRSGLNEFHFDWHGSSLQPGLYDLIFEVDYSDAFPSLSASTVLRRISSATLLQELNRFSVELTDLTANIENLQKSMAEAATSSGQPMPYLEQRKNMLQRALDQGQQALHNADWKTCSRNVEYLQSALPALEAALTFSGNQPDFHGMPAYSLSTARLSNSGFNTSEAPLFLFGLSLPSPDSSDWHASGIEEEAARLRHHGLNFFVLNCPITLDSSEVAGLVARASGASEKEDLLWALQFQQEETLGKLMDVQPLLLEPGFVNLAHDEFNSAYRDQVSSTVRQLENNQNRLVAVSLAENPRFHYDREEVRQGFVSAIQEKYPDRMTLNRLWHAKLATYDEISIWGDSEEHHYHSQRAYQYEWQIFHRSLITKFFTDFKEALTSQTTGIPLTVTLAESAFSPGETRHAAGREDMATLMDLQACTVNFTPGTGVYALNYPVANAYFTLMRSHEPDKAILNLRGDIDVSSLRSAGERRAFVTAALWESVMSGANGFALTHDSSVLLWPDAYEAFVQSALDINRLSSIVSAFQQDSPKIGILFSEAAKIMDDGIPHLESVRFAFEGSSFAGFAIQYLTETQILKNALENLKVLVMPETMAISDEAFEQIDAYVEAGGMVARVGTPIPYNESGISRSDVIRTSPNTVLVRGMNLPTEYLHAMDAVLDRGQLPLIPRPVNAFGYPLEGVRSRYVRLNGVDYLYIINLRHTPATVHITGGADRGRDLILSREVSFPRVMESLETLLIQLDSPAPATNIPAQ